MRIPMVPPLALLVMFAMPLAAQVGEPSRPRQVTSGADAPVKLDIDLVVMDAQVVEKETGKIVGGLTQRDFVLFEDGNKQQISHFSQNSLPLSVLLVLDRGGCLDPISETVRAAARDTIARFKPEDEVAIMAFADRVDLVKGFSTNRASVVEALNRVPGHDEEAEHCFNLALYDAADYMLKASNPYGRRVIIFVTGITRGFDCEGPSNKEAMQAILESGSVVCALVPSSAEQRMENGAMIGIGGIAGVFGAPTTNLNKFAEETGGEILNAKTADLHATFDTLIEHLRMRYTLGFVSTNTKPDGSFRKLKLELTPEAKKRAGKKPVVQTRRGYVAAVRQAAPPD